MEKIGFIGVGKVGSALTAYLQQHNYKVIGFYNGQHSSPKKIAEKLGITIYDDLAELVQASDTLFITTPDSEIAKVSEEIAALPSRLEGKLLLHCSGALSSNVYNPCQDRGASVGSIHPLQAFVGAEEDHRQLRQTFFTVESPEDDCQRLMDMMTVLGNRHQWIDSDKKTLYHGAAVMMSNYMVTLIEEGLTYLRTLDFDDHIAIEMMMPLMMGTLTNIHDHGTVNGLTGPLVRGDDRIVAAHIDVIQKQIGSEAGQFYKQMGLRTLHMVQDKRMNRNTSNRFEALFKEK